MFPYNPGAPYQQYNGFGLTPEQVRAQVMANLAAGQVIRMPVKQQASGGIPLWVWIAGGAVLAGAGYWFFVR